MVNGDPYRSTPQPAERRVINRSGAAYRPADEPQAVKEEAPKAPARPASSSRAERFDSEKRSNSRWPLWTVIIVLIVAIVGVASYFLLNNTQKADTGIDTSRYQAVFLVNGQIYFGKLSDFNDTSYKLVDIYYPQAQTTTETETETDATDTTAGIQLIKLGDEVHGPEDEMFISKEQTLYYENLKEDSRVSQLIKENQ